MEHHRSWFARILCILDQSKKSACDRPVGILSRQQNSFVVQCACSLLPSFHNQCLCFAGSASPVMICFICSVAKPPSYRAKASCQIHHSRRFDSGLAIGAFGDKSTRGTCAKGQKHEHGASGLSKYPFSGILSGASDLRRAYLPLRAQSRCISLTPQLRRAETL